MRKKTGGKIIALHQLNSPKYFVISLPRRFICISIWLVRIIRAGDAPFAKKRFN
jgi:hypothetical protein